ncbi:hypothetical protein TWF679_009129 [Orbilia oligospora]|nr:hypothetical protein TWF679_009129 [Orbilia oligospora]
MWGPFRADGSGRVDWEKLEAIMVVLGFNLKVLVEESDMPIGNLWGVKFRGAIPYSAPHLKPNLDNRLELPLDLRDPYGATGTWLRVVCFLAPADGPRPPIDIREAIRFIKLGITVTKIEPPGPGDGQALPVVHFKGASRLMHAFWDPNANSELTGTVRLTTEGEIRWTSFSIFQGEERWRSEGTMEEHFDIVVVGAGLAGISAAYRVQTMLPNRKFLILEARERIGGTWDIFKYPGIRSDSDLTTYGFPFAPWTKERQIANGSEIADYIQETVKSCRLEDKIRLSHRVLTADWCSREKRWKLTVSENGTEVVIYTEFVLWGSGYYDQWEGLNPIIPGIERFEGIVAHPQFWPEDLDYSSKRVVVIGSGATAITLLPAMSRTAAHVTMLQRSPSYILPIPMVAAEDRILRAYLPKWISSRLVRWKYLLLPRLTMELCRYFPGIIRAGMRRLTKALLPVHIPQDPHFEPKYKMGEQRICLAPDGDFFKCLHTSNASIVTDTIDTVTSTGLELGSGSRLSADIIVTATGLKIQLFGGAHLKVDGQMVNISEKYAWNGTMLQDIPNAAMMIGYTSTAWTLGADIMAQLVIKVMVAMEKRGAKVVTPRLDLGMGVNPAPLLDINATQI